MAVIFTMYVVSTVPLKKPSVDYVTEIILEMITIIIIVKITMNNKI